MSDLSPLIEVMRKAQPAIARLVADSRKVQAGDAFLAFPGTADDGRTHIQAAIEAGAAAVLWEPQGFTWNPAWTVFNQAVPGLKGRAAELANAWYDAPSEALWLIGVTGTNGKTSCSHWLAASLNALGRRTALIGTLGNGFPACAGEPEAMSATGHTTPDAVTLHSLLADYRAVGAEAVAMEVSSHALDQGRVGQVRFDVAVLTNLSRDHLDYHGDMASYAQAKARLFAWPGLKCAVLNRDDAFGQSLLDQLKGGRVRVLSYGLEAGDIHAEELRIDRDGLRMTVVTPSGRGELHSPQIGEYNASNLLACLAALLASDVALGDALRALSAVPSVPGRMQRVPTAGEGPTVIVDYAHTPDALHKVLATLKPLVTLKSVAGSGRLVCVFGCGGGRDKGKRPQMGGIASALADRVIVTSDNPRHEDPATIIAEVLAGMPPGQDAIVDRREAIRQAIREAGANDIVLIAGKGHEDYQEIQGQRLPFSDIEEAAAALRTWGNT